jgi:zinc protease
MKNPFKTLFVLLTLLFVLIAFGTAFAQTVPGVNFEKYELNNGLDVILHEDHSIPTVTVCILYNVGSQNEKRGRTGFAHLFEHLMFEGSEHVGEDFTPWMESIGGDNNAMTSEDRTIYYETVPSNHLERVLWIEADRMGFLPPAITQEKLDIQRDVVKNERRQSLDNQPYQKAYELTLTALYPSDHPYSWSVIGSMDDLEAASLDDVKNFFKTFYIPNNASLVIAGDFNSAQAKEWVEKYFGALSPGAPIDRTDVWIPQVSGVKRVTAGDRVSLPRFHSVWPTPPTYSTDDSAIDLFATIIGGGKTSRLYQALVYDRQIAQDVSAYNSGGKLNSTFNIEVTAKEGHTVAEIEQAVNEVLSEALSNGIKADELKNAQNTREAGFVRSMQRTLVRAIRLNVYNTYLGDPGKFQWDVDRYTKVSVADVNAAARKWISLDQRVIVNIVPQQELEATGAMPDWSVIPAPAADPQFAPPAIQETRLANGLRVLLVEKHVLPLVQVDYVLRSGWSDDPADKPGAARLTADMLDEGTKTRSALKIAEDARALGANMWSTSSFDGSYITLNILKKNLDNGLELMTDVLFNSTFPEPDLEKVRKRYLGDIQQEKNDPEAVASKVYNRLLYGNDHPYSQPTTGSGTEASISALTRDDLTTFYKTHYFPDDATLVVVGDLTLDEAKAKLEKYFKNWKPVKAQHTQVPAPPASQGIKIYLVDKPGAPQSVIIAGHAGIERLDPDYAALEVANNAFGGQFSSRLNSNLREDKGYTYGAWSYFSDRRGVGPFVVQTSVQTQYTDESIREIVNELKLLTGSKPLQGQELSESKDNLIKSDPSKFETYVNLAEQLNDIALLGLPLESWKTYVHELESVTEEKVAQAVAKYIRPDDLMITIVGDRAQIEPELRALNLGDVKVVDLAELNL